MVLATRGGETVARFPRETQHPRNPDFDESEWEDIPKHLREQDDLMTAGEMEYEELMLSCAVCHRMSRHFARDGARIESGSRRRRGCDADGLWRVCLTDASRCVRRGLRRLCLAATIHSRCGPRRLFLATLCPTDESRCYAVGQDGFV